MRPHRTASSGYLGPRQIAGGATADETRAGLPMRVRRPTLRTGSTKLGEDTMGKNEKTSSKVATQAAKVLANKISSKTDKSIAGSALTQRPDKKK